MYYYKNGKKIKDVLEWAKLLEDKDYKIVKQENVGKKYWVSTVWLGIDYSFGMGEPLIFETMVFSQDRKESDLDMERYSTLEEAEKGHQRMCNKWSKLN